MTVRLSRVSSVPRASTISLCASISHHIPNPVIKNLLLIAALVIANIRPLSSIIAADLSLTTARTANLSLDLLSHILIPQAAAIHHHPEWPCLLMITTNTLCRAFSSSPTLTCHFDTYTDMILAVSILPPLLHTLVRRMASLLQAVTNEHRRSRLPCAGSIWPSPAKCATAHSTERT
ncbi:hypothetical protein GQ44DRAFT_405474 [Phaeosphaeriaceae sp. PMI808]|nr:hypothetical protein GQ44DRAFT_405474 [Phaeosphaeriaceae sp. PMI808]